MAELLSYISDLTSWIASRVIGKAFIYGLLLFPIVALIGYGAMFSRRRRERPEKKLQQRE